MKTAQHIGNLTKALTQAEQELERLQDDVRDALHQIENNKSNMISQAVAAMPQADPNKSAFLESIIEDNIDEALTDINKARNIIGRLRTVTRSAIEIARRAEQTWYDALMDFVRDTKWYKERFPYQHEERRRKREYEHYKTRPEQFYPRPLKNEQGVPTPELEDIRISSLHKRAQIESTIESLFRQIMQIIQLYFMADSPILRATDSLTQKVRRRINNQTDRMLERGLRDQLYALENLFGFEQQPGRYITSGSRAFLMPAARLLRNAIVKLQEPLNVSQTQTVVEELAQALPAEEVSLTSVPTESGGVSQSERTTKTLERLGCFMNRQKRCYTTQRIASSR